MTDTSADEVCVCGHRKQAHTGIQAKHNRCWVCCQGTDQTKWQCKGYTPAPAVTDELDINVLTQGLHDEKVFVAEGMVAEGGGFMSLLGKALYHADSNNAKKLMIAYPDEWEKYRDVGRRLARARGDL